MLGGQLAVCQMTPALHQLGMEVHPFPFQGAEYEVLAVWQQGHNQPRDGQALDVVLLDVQFSTMLGRPLASQPLRKSAVWRCPCLDPLSKRWFDAISRRVISNHGSRLLPAFDVAEAEVRFQKQCRQIGQMATPKGWFEEDCDWALVALSFPEEWKAWRGERAANDLEAAERTLKEWILPKGKQQ